ncbi:selenophosphate synthase [Halanaerobium salsuginis]|jgi:selenide,water dikinase|uniref:Selenide, water dikinase n=2 Tax=Halanaerobium salsuginis TaxID=29563 RepID=A0A1I4FSI4_9FIRM|nr:selenophosphate synthase [Halanaerobium salsuginis]
MGPDSLAQVLRQVDFKTFDKKLLVGLDKSDDAIAYQLNKSQVIVQSVDFFTPIVDDPYLFGQIAAANALSDIYAMGAEPILAMNIVGFPSCLSENILAKILQGGAAKVAEAGAIIAGGHTIQDDEPKYGLSVTGLVEPAKLLTNSGCQPGDKLILTKPLGMGIMATAIKAGLAEGGLENEVVKAMADLNKTAAKVMQKIGVNACTDITGFGFLGHSLELAKGSKVGIEIFSQDIPIFSEITEYAEMGLVPAGAYTNKNYLADQLTLAPGLAETTSDILFDPQTSGGLLISVSSAKVADLLIELYAAGIEQATVVGEVFASPKGALIVKS